MSRRLQGIGEKDQCRDQEHIQDDGHGRRFREPPQRIQHPAKQGHERDKQDKGEGDPCQQNRKIKLHLVIGKPAGQHINHRRCEQFHQPHQQKQDNQQPGKGFLGKNKGLFPAVLFQGGGKHGHKGCAEGAFSKEAAEKIGQLERHDEAIGHHPGAQDRCHQDIADETENTAQKSKTAENGGGFKNGHVSETFSCHRGAIALGGFQNFLIGFFPLHSARAFVL